MDLIELENILRCVSIEADTLEAAIMLFLGNNCIAYRKEDNRVGQNKREKRKREEKKI